MSVLRPGIPAGTPPWLISLLEDDCVTDLCLNGSRDAWADRGEGMERIDLPQSWDDSSMQAWVFALLAQLGRAWDARNPFLDAASPSGHRYHFTFPPVCQRGITLSIRRLPGARPGRTLSTPESRWALESESGSASAFGMLSSAAVAGDPILIAGATGSGKTTLLNDLLSRVPANERIIALEDTAELRPDHPHFLSLLGRTANADGFGELTLRTLLRQSLRMRPDRIILGECRGQEVLELIQALNTGHRGSLATLHANSPRDAIRRLELLCLMASEGTLPLGTIRELLAHGLRWVAHVSRTPSGRRISELCRIEGREGDTILLRPMINPNQWNPPPPSLAPRNPDLQPLRPHRLPTEP